MEKAGDATHQKLVDEFDDDIMDLWVEVLGEHLHHGYYEPDVSSALADRPAAQLRLIEEILSFAGVSDEPEKKPKSIIDVGCGLGGCSRFLAKKYGAQVKGITIIAGEARRGQDLANAQGLGDKVSLQVADALDQPFPDGSFDLVWALESGELMPDKKKFVSELVRVAKPGATVIIVTSCHRNLLPREKSLRPGEIDVLKKISEGFYTTHWCSPSDYIKILKTLPVKDIKEDDWSDNVKVTWAHVIKGFFSEKVIKGLNKCGPRIVIAAQTLPLMCEAFSRKLIKFSIITFRKSE